MCAYILCCIFTEEDSFFKMFMFSNLLYIYRGFFPGKCSNSSKTGREVAMRLRRGMYVSENKSILCRRPQMKHLAVPATVQRELNKPQVHKQLLIYSLFPSPVTL